MQLVKNLFTSQKTPTSQEANLNQQQAGVLQQNLTPLISAPTKYGSMVSQKSDAEKVFEHLCPANSLTIDSQYLLNALLYAEIIDRSQLSLLHVQIEELMEAIGSRQGSNRDLIAAAGNLADGPSVNTKYMNQAQLDSRQGQQENAQNEGPFGAAIGIDQSGQGQRNSARSNRSLQVIPGSQEVGNRRKSHSVTPNSVYQLTLTTFSALMNRMEEKTRQKLVFNFMSVLGPEQLVIQQQADLQNFRKRNNPSEDDVPLMVEEVSSLGQMPLVSAKDASFQEAPAAGKRQETFEDIVPIVVEDDNFGGNQLNDSDGMMEFEAHDVASDDDQAGQGQQAPNKNDDEYSEHLSNEEQLNFSQSKITFEDKQVKSSRRYIKHSDEAENDFENLKGLPESQDIVLQQKVDHTAEIEQDIMPQNHQSRLHNETEQSEFRRLPQIDSFESDTMKKGSNRNCMQAKGDFDDPVIFSTQADNLGGLLLGKDGVLDSKNFYSRPQQRTLMSSIEFHSGVKEIQQQKSIVLVHKDQQASLDEPLRQSQDIAIPSEPLNAKAELKLDVVSLNEIKLEIGTAEHEKDQSESSYQKKRPDAIATKVDPQIDQKVSPDTPQTPHASSTTLPQKDIKKQPSKNSKEGCCCSIF